MELPLNPVTDPDKLKGFLESIGSYSGALILPLPAGQFLFHYATLEGVKGIVTGDDLWLTHTQYCNDDAELTYGLQLTRSVIQEQLAAGDDAKKQYLSALLTLMDRPELDAVYICCFCEQDDLLSQWRAYASNATGVSLGFSPRQFDYITGPDCPPDFGLMRLWKVFYSEDTQKQIVRSALTWYPNTQSTASPSDWAQWTSEAIRFFLPTFKNPAFAEEKEWRLIFTPSVQKPLVPSYRVARGMLIPHYSLKELASNIGLPPQKLPIISLRIGPGPNRMLNAASAKTFLNKYGYSVVAVDVSQAPYRV